jgi:DNA-binding HxlR family transcriptional regulator
MANGYGQDCPVARTLDVIGEKWSLLVLRDLFRKGLCFQELEQAGKAQHAVGVQVAQAT